MLDDHKLALLVGVIGFVGAILGGVLSGVYQHLLEFKRRPRLELKFEDCSASELDSPYMRHASWEENGEKLGWLVVRASILNKGTRTAKRCRVYLVELHEIHDGRQRPAGFYDSVSLPWAGWDFDPRDIPPHVTSFLDVVRFRKDVPAWDFTFRVFSGDRETLNQFAGVYRFHLVATADNAASAHSKIDVEYRKDWHNARARKV